jgi:hypothetical protein
MKDVLLQGKHAFFKDKLYIYIIYYIHERHRIFLEGMLHLFEECLV